MDIVRSSGLPVAPLSIGGGRLARQMVQTSDEITKSLSSMSKRVQALLVENETLSCEIVKLQGVLEEKSVVYEARAKGVDERLKALGRVLFEEEVSDECTFDECIANISEHTTKLRKQISALESVITDKDNKITKLKKDATDKETALAQQTSKIATLNARIRDLSTPRPVAEDAFAKALGDRVPKNSYKWLWTPAGKVIGMDYAFVAQLITDGVIPWSDKSREIFPYQMLWEGYHLKR